MPLVEVLGVPRMFRWRRRKFKSAIREAVAAIPEMKLSPSDVSVLTFREAGGYDGEIHVRVTFNERVERTNEVRYILAEKTAIVIDKWFPKTNLIKTWGNPFPPTNGFHYIRRDKWYC